MLALAMESRHSTLAHSPACDSHRRVWGDVMGAGFSVHPGAQDTRQGADQYTSLS
jgi:hypothetical protein